MTDRPPYGPEFLQRQTYRRRRLADAGRILPVFGLVLFLLPPLLQGTRGTAATGLLIFGGWIVMIGVGALIARALDRPEDPGSAPERPEDPAP